MTTAPPSERDHRLRRARELAEASGQTLEVWTGNGATPQRFTTPARPGVALTFAELRALPADPSVYRYARVAPDPPTPPGYSEITP